MKRKTKRGAGKHKASPPRMVFFVGNIGPAYWLYYDANTRSGRVVVDAADVLVDDLFIGHTEYGTRVKLRAVAVESFYRKEGTVFLVDVLAKRR